MTLDPFHPATIARARRHADRGGRPRCAADGKAGRDAVCTCEPDPATLAECWAGRARMARARRAAGVELDAVDRQALDVGELGGAA